jgi:hypothetical protein
VSRAGELSRSSEFTSTKPAELEFRALLTDTTPTWNVARPRGWLLMCDKTPDDLGYTNVASGEAPTWKGKAMRKKQKVAEMADKVLARQAKTRADRTGEPFEAALEAVMGTEAGRQLRDLRNGPHHDERAQEWQESLARQRAEERSDALGWSSSKKGPGSPTDVSRRGPG